MSALRVLFALALIGFVQGSPRAKRQGLVQMACKRDPTLPYCPKQISEVLDDDADEVAAAVPPVVVEKVAPKVIMVAPTVPPVIVEKIVEEVVPEVVIVPPTHPPPTAPPPTIVEEVVEAVAPLHPNKSTTPINLLAGVDTGTLAPVKSIINNGQLAAGVDFAPYCVAYKERYYYYCTDIIAQPVELQAKLYRYCPLYRRYCNPVHTSPQPAFPTIPTTVVTTPQPCTNDCKAAHCTPNCKCVYSGKKLKEQCTGDGEGGSGAFAFIQNTCQMWWDSCYHILTEKQKQYVNYLMADKYKSKERNDGAGQTDIMTKHDEKPQTQMWQQPNSQHTDWMNGDIRQGSDWAVPAFGISGTAGESSVKFPSIGSFAGKRRKRMALMMAKMYSKV